MNLDKREGRSLDTIRPVKVELGFHRFAEGSVLYRCGETRVLATASVDESVPDFLKGTGRGWLTAEYQMHPRANPQRRERRDGRERSLSGRSREIQRLIGRGLRAAVALDRLGERSLIVDCDVLEADGGTRTASVTAGYLALALAVNVLKRKGLLEVPVLNDQVAAISVGHVDGDLALDLCYKEDSAARVDLNLVGTGKGSIVEVQGTAEGQAVPKREVDQMIELGLYGIKQLCEIQLRALADYGIELGPLMAEPS